MKDEPPERVVPRGTFLLLKDASWRNEYVVLLICEWLDDIDCRYSMVRVSGSKGGVNPLQLWPNSAFETEEVLTVGWLIKNWNEWIWAESDVSSVEICYEPVSVECFR